MGTRQDTKTSDMVKKVMSWKQQDPNATRVFDELNNANNDIIADIEKMSELNKANPEHFGACLEQAVVGQESSDPLSQTLRQLVTNLRTAFIESRRQLRKLGQAAGGMSVEPVELTILADVLQTNCLEVLAAGIPGAGGYDAFFCLVVGANPKQKIRDFLKPELIRRNLNMDMKFKVLDMDHAPNACLARSLQRHDARLDKFPPIAYFQ